MSQKTQVAVKNLKKKAHNTQEVILLKMNRKIKVVIRDL